MPEWLKGWLALILILGAVLGVYYVSIAVALLIFFAGVISVAAFFLYCVWEWLKEAISPSDKK